MEENYTFSLHISDEDDLQPSIYNLNIIETNHNMEMSTEKTVILAFQGKDPY
jgi:hypothetical protein